MADKRFDHLYHRTSTRLDFYIWGYMNHIIYENKIDIHVNIIHRIVDAATRIYDGYTLRSLTRSLTKRTVMCIAAKGVNFKPLIQQ
jgi:hypothetical protein